MLSGGERSDKGNDLWNKGADLGEQVQESGAGPHDDTMTLENFPKRQRPSPPRSCNACLRVYARDFACECKLVSGSVCVCVCERVAFKGRRVLGGGKP